MGISVNKQCLIIGCGSHCHAVISAIHSAGGYSIAGIIDTCSPCNPNEDKLGYPVIGEVSDPKIQKLMLENFAIFLAIGDNTLRARLFYQLDKAGMHLPNVMASSAIIDSSVLLGKANYIGHRAVINAGARIGNNTILNTGAIIEHDAQVGDHCHLAPASVICGAVNVEDYCLIGAGAVVIPKLNISQQSVVGAQACVTSSINTTGKTWVGVPAKEMQK